MKIFYALLLFPLSALADCPSWPKAIADMHVSACKVVNIAKSGEGKENRLLLSVRIKDLYVFSAYEPLNSEHKYNFFKKGQEFRVLMDKVPTESCGVMKYRQSRDKYYKAILTKSCCDTGSGYSCLYDEIFGTPIPGTWFDDGESLKLDKKDDWDEKGLNQKSVVDAKDAQHN